MHNPPDILSLAYKQSYMQDQMVMLQEREQQIPGSVQYTINRNRRLPQWNIEDTGMLVYHYQKTEPKDNYLELKFCVSGNVYCRKKDTEFDMCQFSASKTCMEWVDSVDVVSFRFYPVHLSQFVKPRTMDEVSKNIEDRDHTDTHRAESPLRKAEDAIVLDNSDLNQEEQLAIALDLVRQRSVQSPA